MCGALWLVRGSFGLLHVYSEVVHSCESTPTVTRLKNTCILKLSRVCRHWSLCVCRRVCTSAAREHARMKSRLGSSTCMIPANRIQHATISSNGFIYGLLLRWCVCYPVFVIVVANIQLFTGHRTQTGAATHRIPSAGFVAKLNRASMRLQQARTAQWLASILCLFPATAWAGLRSMPEGAGTLRAAQSKARELLQAGATEVPVILHAKDYEEFTYALENYAQDIELHGHIDLRGIEDKLGFDGTVLPALEGNMRSLRVRFPSGNVHAIATMYTRHSLKLQKRNAGLLHPPQQHVYSF